MWRTPRRTASLSEDDCHAHLQLGPELSCLSVSIVLLDEVQLCLEPVPGEEGRPVVLPLVHLGSKGKVADAVAGGHRTTTHRICLNPG